MFAINEVLDQALRNTKRNPQYAYIAPTYGQAKRVAWQMLKDYTKNIPGVVTNEQDLKVVIERPHSGDRITIMLLGAENPGAIRGIYLDGVIMDEFAEMHPDVWGQVVRPALSDRLGWAIFIGTPKGYNHFHDVYDNAKKDPRNWYRVIYKASETMILPASELEAARLTMSEEEYEQEFECSFGAALIGAYYTKQLQRARTENRITTVPYDRAVPVGTYWDLGIGDSTAIWFVQTVGREYHVIDHIEMSGQGLDYYVKALKDRPYVYDEHVLPHDAAARELGTGKTRVEMLQGYGLGGRIRVLEKHAPDDGIHAVRMILDKTWFDEKSCERGLDCLLAYQKKWDAKNAIFTATPLHNWASHSADGFRTFAMGVRDPSRRTDIAKLSRQSESGYDIFNYSGERR